MNWLRSSLVALVVHTIVAPVYADDHHPHVTAWLRAGALGAAGLNVATVLYPQKSDVRAAATEGALWGVTWGTLEKRHPNGARAIYIVMLVGNTWGAGYKIHARWGTQQF